MFWNEGRYDLSLLAKKSVEINSSNVDQSQNGNLVAVTGVVTTSENISDNLFIQPGNYLAISRSVETYAWVEETETSSTNNKDGSETDTTTYTYKKRWTDEPESSVNFKHRDGHENSTTTPLSNVSTRVKNGSIGEYTFDVQNVSLPSFEKLSLTTNNTILNEGASISSDQYIYLSKTGGTFDNPSLGDERVSYSVLTPGFTGTLFGKQNNSNIESYRDKDDHLLFNLLRGGREDGIASLHSDFVFWTWIFRLVGFLMMWIGLSLLFGWITTLANILPFLGGLTGAFISLITFITAVIVSVTTMLVSMIVHSLIAVLIAVVVVIAVLIFFARRIKQDTNSTPTQSTVTPVQSSPTITPIA